MEDGAKADDKPIQEAENFRPSCGNCYFFYEAYDPEKKERLGRGFCCVNPPQVFLVPTQTSPANIAMAGGQQSGKIEMIPHMHRPVVEADEPNCKEYKISTREYNRIRKMNDNVKSCGGDCGGCKADEGGDCGKESDSPDGEEQG